MRAVKKLWSLGWLCSRWSCHVTIHARTEWVSTRSILQCFEPQTGDICLCHLRGATVSTAALWDNGYQDLTTKGQSRFSPRSQQRRFQDSLSLPWGTVLAFGQQGHLHFHMEYTKPRPLLTCWLHPQEHTRPVHRTRALFLLPTRQMLRQPVFEKQTQIWHLPKMCARTRIWSLFSSILFSVAHLPLQVQNLNMTALTEECNFPTFSC